MNHKTKKYIYNSLVIILLLAAFSFLCSKFIHFGNVEFTDNAQVKQLIVPVNSRLQGTVKELRFDEYQFVNKGDTLMILEDAEFSYRLAQAEADYQNAMAGKSVSNSSVQTATNNVLVSEAAIAEVKALLDLAAKEEKRYQSLLDQESVTQQEFDAIHTKYVSLKAKYETLARQKQSQVLVKSEQSNRISQNDAHINLAARAIDLARLNLSYTVIIAPTSGYTGRKNVQVGQLIQPGQTVVDIIDNNEKWIIANYKETQTHHLVEGQAVEVKVDAFDGMPLKGIVKSISNATGSAFSLLPHDNAAGNFVKIEQRIPVRIEFDKDNNAEQLRRLRAGMNVECFIKY